jgi:hypothetical protein
MACNECCIRPPATLQFHSSRDPLPKPADAAFYGQVLRSQDLEPLPLLSSSLEDNLDLLKSSLLRGKLLDFAANTDRFRETKVLALRR